MKKLKHIIFFAIGALTFLGSCLDDTGYLDIYNGENGGPVVSFGQAEHGKVVKTVEILDGPQDVEIAINMARANADMTITVSVDEAALEKYNADETAKDSHFVPFTLLPDSVYSIPSTSVSIPRGTLDASFVVSLLSAKIDLGEQYMLPLVITNADNGVTIAANLKTALLSVVVKNKYDGIYTVTGTAWVDNVVPTITSYYPWTASLVTNGATQNVLQDEEGYYSDPRVHLIKSGTSVSSYGGFIVVFNFDANNNVTSVINLLGQPNPANTRSAKLDPTGVNKFDPVTKTLRVKYHMIQTNQATGTSPRVTFDETYTYVGPRK
jgi:hypothetical protein